MAKITTFESDRILFDDGSTLESEHESSCCEQHYLSFADIEAGDFIGLEFDLDSDDFFARVDGYGIQLLPVNGHPLSIPGYGYNNGYYSDNLTLVLCRPGQPRRTFDISDCQVVEG